MIIKMLFDFRQDIKEIQDAGDLGNIKLVEILQKQLAKRFVEIVNPQISQNNNIVFLKSKELYNLLCMIYEI